MATIYFGSGLAQHTGGVDSMTVDAPRVHELLQAVIERFPGIQDPLDLMAIAVDGVVHTHADFIPLTDKSEVYVVPRIAGGAKCEIRDTR